jgi:hypothetical protein
MLEVKKIYIDTRFKSSDSYSETDFYIDLPKTVNLDNVKCYIDDIVLPISFKVVEEHNQNLYFSVFYFDGSFYTTRYFQIILPSTNYNGNTLSTTLQTLMNSKLVTGMYFTFSITYDFVDNLLNITIIDEREDKTGIVANVFIISNHDLINTTKWGIKQNVDSIKSLNQILRITETIELTNIAHYEAYIDLHTTRNLYLHSSALCSYNIISNFNLDTIIKKIPVRAGYNEMLFDGVSDGMDYLDLTRRSLNRIDFRLTDSYGNLINLHNNHWSLSLIFVE